MRTLAVVAEAMAVQAVLAAIRGTPTSVTVARVAPRFRRPSIALRWAAAAAPEPETIPTATIRPAVGRLVAALSSSAPTNLAARERSRLTESTPTTARQTMQAAAAAQAAPSWFSRPTAEKAVLLCK